MRHLKDYNLNHSSNEIYVVDTNNNNTPDICIKDADNYNESSKLK